MGSCGTKLPKENSYKLVSLNTHIKPKRNTFTKPEKIETCPSNTHANGDLSNNGKLSGNVQEEPLIILTFNRTLFCEDITYEYEMSCNIPNTPKWKLRLTVENLTKFYIEILQKYSGNKINIPLQFGKIMLPEVFTSLLENVLQQPSMLKDKIFCEATANFLNIPSELRSILQYNPETFTHRAIMDEDIFKFFSIISANNDKYKYLCHSMNTYTLDYERHWQQQITCYSYWIRSLKNSIDFLLNITNNNTFSIIMSDLSYNISQILMNNTALDKHSAWIITDYLPKHLLFNQKDETSKPQIVYKCNNESGSFLLKTGNKLLKRHNINAEELRNMCEKLCTQHVSILDVKYTECTSLQNYESESIDFMEGTCSSNDVELILLPMVGIGDFAEDQYVTSCNTLMEYDNDKIMQSNNYNFTPSNLSNTVVDVDENENELFPDSFVNAKM